MYLDIKNAPPKIELYLSNFRGALHAGGDFFCPPPACGLAASVLRYPAWLHCPASCRACQAVPGAALLPLVPAAPALPAVFPGFRALVSSPGFRRAVPWLFPYSCSVWFQAGAFLSRVFRPNALLSLTVCRRMTWLPAAFSRAFLFPGSCPAPFVCVGCPLFPAVFGHAVCGFRRGFPVHALSVWGLSPSAGRVRLALKAFSFCTAFGQSCFFYSASVVTGALCCLDYQPMRPPRWDPLFSGSLKVAFWDSAALIHCQPSFWLSSASPGRTRICFLPGRDSAFRKGTLVFR